MSERMAEYATAAALGAFDAIVIAASAFPDGLQAVGTNSAGSVDRVDYLAWRRYRRKALEHNLPMTSYADYGIQHPRLVANLRNPQQTAGIRYTLDREWLILRGDVITKANRAEQFVSLAKNLVAAPQYMTAQHCFGCRAVKDTADQAGDDMIVDLGGWRRYGTVHHLTTALQQLRGELA